MQGMGFLWYQRDVSSVEYLNISEIYVEYSAKAEVKLNHTWLQPQADNPPGQVTSQPPDM